MACSGGPQRWAGTERVANSHSKAIATLENDVSFRSARLANRLPGTDAGHQSGNDESSRSLAEHGSARADELPRDRSFEQATAEQGSRVKVLVQRVLQASVTVEQKVVGEISQGLLAFVGVAHADGLEQVRWLAEKFCQLRVFEDQQGRMNRSLQEIQGSALIVSQFTLLADCRKGRRPAFTDAAAPEHARAMYEAFIDEVRLRQVPVQTGIFAASMQVALINDGPVTLLLERS